MDLELIDYSYIDYMHKMLEIKFNYYERIYSKILNINILKKIYNLWYFNIEYEPNDGLEYFHLSSYYNIYKNDIIKSNILLDKAIELKNDFALTKLAVKYSHMSGGNYYPKNCNKCIDILNQIESCDHSIYALIRLYREGCNECSIDINIEKAKYYALKKSEYIPCIVLLLYYYRDNDKLFDELLISTLKKKIYFSIFEDYDFSYNSTIIKLINNVKKFYSIIEKNIYSEDEFNDGCMKDLNEYEYKNDYNSHIKLGKIYYNFKKNINLSIRHFVNAYEIDPSNDLFNHISSIIVDNINDMIWLPSLYKFWKSDKYDKIIKLLLCIYSYKHLSKFISNLNRDIILYIINFVMHNF